MRLESAIFDMDGTLLDSMFAWRGLGPELLRRHGITVTEEMTRCFREIEAEGTAAYLREACGLALSDGEIYREMKQCMAEFYGSRVLPKPGAKELLSRLAEKGVNMYIATATDRDLVETALRHTGLGGFFGGILTSREVGSHKASSPEIYREALRRMDARKEACVVFEDAPHAVRTAKADGFRVAVIYDAAAEKAQGELRQLADFYIEQYSQWLETNTIE